MKDEYYDAIRLLPGWLAAPLAAVPPEQAALIHEIRLRQGQPVQFTVRGQPLAAERCSPGLAALTVPPGRMEEVLYTLCGGSVHAMRKSWPGAFSHCRADTGWAWAAHIPVGKTAGRCCSRWNP